MATALYFVTVGARVNGTVVDTTVIPMDFDATVAGTYPPNGFAVDFDLPDLKAGDVVDVVWGFNSPFVGADVVAWFPRVTLLPLPASD